MYNKFTLSFRDIEELLTARGAAVSYNLIAGKSKLYSKAIVVLIQVQRHPKTPQCFQACAAMLV